MTVSVKGENKEQQRTHGAVPERGANGGPSVSLQSIQFPQDIGTVITDRFREIIVGRQSLRDEVFSTARALALIDIVEKRVGAKAPGVWEPLNSKESETLRKSAKRYGEQLLEGVNTKDESKITEGYVSAREAGLKILRDRLNSKASDSRYQLTKGDSAGLELVIERLRVETLEVKR